MTTLKLTSALRLPRPSLAETVHSLDRHLRQCNAARSRLFSAASLCERAHGVVAPRFVTTVSIAAIVLAVCTGWV